MPSGVTFVLLCLRSAAFYLLCLPYLPTIEAYCSVLLKRRFPKTTAMKSDIKINTDLASAEAGVILSDDSSDNATADAGTGLDKKDMYRMGKTQELHRNFRFMSIFGFTMVLMATWEAQLK